MGLIGTSLEFKFGIMEWVTKWTFTITQTHFLLWQELRKSLCLCVWLSVIFVNSSLNLHAISAVSQWFLSGLSVVSQWSLSGFLAVSQQSLSGFSTNPLRYLSGLSAVSQRFLSGFGLVNKQQDCGAGDFDFPSPGVAGGNGEDPTQILHQDFDDFLTYNPLGVIGF